MSLDEARLNDYLRHMLEAIQRVERYTADVNLTGFLGSTLIQDAVLRNLEILGEASNNILKRFPDFAASCPAIPFDVAYQMRNAIAHGYFKVDLEIV